MDDLDTRERKQSEEKINQRRLYHQKDSNVFLTNFFCLP
jgi:hypothetical protein